MYEDWGTVSNQLNQLKWIYGDSTDTVATYANWLSDYFANAGNTLCCCEKRENDETTNNKEDDNMSNTMNGIFGRVSSGLCRLSMSGKIAIKTSNGYKTYDVKTGRLTNCDSFVFNVGEDAFFVIPTNKVERGDIIIANGRPNCVLEIGKNDIRVFCYEDSTINTIVPERHMLMGKQYFYGKIVSMFGNVTEKSGMKQMMKFMMLSEMMKQDKGNSSSMNAFVMMSMLGGGTTDTLFDGMFDFDEEEEEKRS